MLHRIGTSGYCASKVSNSSIYQVNFQSNQLVNLPTGTPNNLFTFSVTMEIREEDGKGNFVAVPRDRDLFKLRVNAAKKVVVAVTQTTNKDLIIER